MTEHLMTEPLVSFIIPVRNGEKFIEQCLTSISRQRYSGGDYEIVVIDNGSTDRTVQIVQGLGIDCEVKVEMNVSSLRNYGVSKSKGQYLAFVDSDVELMPGWLENGMPAFQKESVVAAGCFPMVPPNPTWVQKAWDLHQRRQQYTGSMTPIEWLPSMNLMIRSDDFKAIDGFNETLQTAEDVDLCYRLKERGGIVCNHAMKAIHWGEAPDLRTFWRKEVWRGLGNLPGIFSHGIRWDEIPSIGYPVYILIFMVLVCLGGMFDILAHQFFLFPIAFFFLISPPLVLACYTAWSAQRPAAVPQLFVLFFVYGLARAYAVIKTVRS